jgi:hypothetical protein
MKGHVLTTANAAFKNERKEAEARTAWRDYEANQAAVDANMMRLRALRLARDAAPAAKIKKRIRRS